MSHLAARSPSTHSEPRQCFPVCSCILSWGDFPSLGFMSVKAITGPDLPGRITTREVLWETSKPFPALTSTGEHGAPSAMTRRFKAYLKTGCKCPRQYAKVALTFRTFTTTRAYFPKLLQSIPTYPRSVYWQPQTDQVFPSNSKQHTKPV